jgi:hypothetical protein
LLMMRHEDWDRLIEAEHAQSGGMDFSAHGVKSRYESGYKAVDKFFARENVSMQPATSEANSLHAA